MYKIKKFQYINLMLNTQVSPKKDPSSCCNLLMNVITFYVSILFNESNKIETKTA